MVNDISYCLLTEEQIQTRVKELDNLRAEKDIAEPCAGEIRHFLDAVHNGIALEDGFIVFQPDPFAPPHAFEHVELLESNHKPKHGLVAKDEIEGHGQDQHNIQAPVPPDPAQSARLFDPGFPAHDASSLRPNV